jgi:hypothetical protein
MHWYNTCVAKGVAIEIPFSCVNARMRGKDLAKAADLALLRDDCANTHILDDEASKRSPRIHNGLSPCPGDPLLGGSSLHCRGDVETESLRVTKDLDHLVGDDLRRSDRPTNQDAGSPAGVDTDSSCAVHIKRTPAPQVTFKPELQEMAQLGKGMRRRSTLKVTQ